MQIHADVNVTTLFQMPSLRWSRPLENSASCIQNLWRHGRATVDTTWANSSADVDVTYRDAEKKRHGTRGFVPGRLAGTILSATTKTFGANDDVQPGGGKSIPGAHTMERQPTKIMKHNDVPQGVLRSQINVAGLLIGIRNNLPLCGGRETELDQTHGPVPEFAMVNICIRLPAEQVFVSGCLQSRSWSMDS